LKITLIVHFAPALSFEPQLLLWVKSPLAEMAWMWSVASPVLLSVTDFGGLAVFTTRAANESDAGDTVAAGPTPVPVRAMFGAGPETLLFRTRVPLRLPRAVGVKVTLTVQTAFGGKLPGQLLVWLKSPVTVNPLMDNGSLPVLVRVTLRATLDVFTNCGA
jgi:hypothetical protein